MNNSPADSCCVLNGGGGAWAFAALADLLSRALWVDVSETPREYNYLLHHDDAGMSVRGEHFIPPHAQSLAADKRLLAEVFAQAGVPTPQTHLLSSRAEVEHLLTATPGRAWCVKYPTGCGASGHRLLEPGMTLPEGWPLPLVVQEFVRLDRPEVYRTYAARGDLFGWVARRFPAGVRPSPWVAHARGARYELAGEIPTSAREAARLALDATGLLRSFGCVDLLCRPSGEWLVLEVGTDGPYNHVDRDLELPDLERELHERVADAFWARRGSWRPWGSGPWRLRPTGATP